VLLRRGVAASFAIVACSVFALIVDLGFGLAGMYVGLAVFCLANFSAYRFTEEQTLLPPRVALLMGLGFIGLVPVVAVASL